MTQDTQPLTRERLEQTILSMIANVLDPKGSAEISLTSSLEHDLHIESLLFIELVIEIENLFNISFDDDHLLIGAYSDVQSFVDHVAEVAGV
jgi:acyl carrier protein